MSLSTKYPQDNSGTLFDVMMQRLALKNDAALARLLEVAPPVISKIRHGVLPFGASMVIKVHETTDWPIRDIKGMLRQVEKMGD